MTSTIKMVNSPRNFFAENSVSNRERLLQLWEHWEDVDVQEIFLPNERPKPIVSEFQDTEVERAAEWNAEMAQRCADKLYDEALAKGM
jgi:hypothetical protein